MKKTLILFSTTDGHTKTICEKIYSLLRNKYSVELISINHSESINVNEYGNIIIGASIRYGKHSHLIHNFIKSNKTKLENIKTAFFSVNVVARKLEKNSSVTNPYLKKFLSALDWKPNKSAVFAGKIDYPSYNFIDKQMIRMIMYLTKGPTDTSKSYEFTDWKKVIEFTNDLENLISSN
ncbi:MAG: menaquinone-dependent protoporphyrinogen IX dehydrogenase [Pelagibacteraceae bacterium]|nr:menaquinone-dependent protoporphyrinogen IX dehydrogenase [Pelagibacteraceae bacterium]|tara:strand:+ start:751 stop:1287 length:537 start_codon:yes stop_codon:yes gene_type:complete